MSLRKRRRRERLARQAADAAASPTQARIGRPIKDRPAHLVAQVPEDPVGRRQAQRALAHAGGRDARPPGGVGALPQANRAVLVGTKIGPGSVHLKDDGTEVLTFAFQPTGSGGE